MRIAVCTVAYMEEEYIKQCIQQWKGLVDKHLVLISTKPWNGVPLGFDKTEEIAKNEGAEVIKRYWETEAFQREWGLAYLMDYDYVLIVDPDEFYTLEDRKTILNSIGKGDYKDVYKIQKMVTYWKTHEWIFDPMDKHKPVVAVNPKTIRFYEHRQTQPFDAENPFSQFIPTIPVICHHFSWVHSDNKVKEKIQSYSHSGNINIDWYEEVWLKWKPNSKLIIRPYGEKSVAKYSPAPEEIIKCI
jgi:glycosyltransferase involved in cell wall biosynthesis